MRIVYSLITLTFLLSANVWSQQSRIWATYYGGSLADEAGSVTTDANGNIYLTGATESTSGIASGGFQNTHGGGLRDAFLIKFAPNGTRLWGTYYGGSGIDYGASVLIDAAGNIYLAGETSSGSGIATVGSFDDTYGGNSDGFLVKFDANGNRIWATYFGNSSSDYIKAATLDAGGNIYCAGYTSSTTGIATVGAHQAVLSGGTDGMVVKFNSAGNRLWATYYGGTLNEQINYANAVATDASANVYIAFTTFSSGIAVGGFQTTFGGSSDGLLVKLNTNGTFQWSTYYGGSGSSEFGHAVATDSTGNVYYSGDVRSAGLAFNGFQNTMSGTSDAILVKFAPNGNRLWATYYGGPSGEPSAASVCTDTAGNVFLAGGTSSSSGIYFNGFQSVQGGQYVVKFDPLCNRICATYYDGQQGQNYVHADKFGNLYFTSRTNSTTGVASGGFQMTYGGGITDAYLVKFNNFQAVSASVSQTNPLCNSQCTGTATATPSGGTSPYTYLWSPSGQTTATITGLCAGSYTVTVTDAIGSTATAVVTITQPTILTVSQSSTSLLCFGDCNASITPLASGGTPTYSYNYIPTGPNNLCAGNYTITVTDANGCFATTTALITQPTVLNANATTTYTSCGTCCDGTASASPTGGTPGYTYVWSPGGQTTSSISGLCNGNYTVCVTDANGCTTCATVSVSFNVGISTALSVTDLVVFPNPFNDQVTVYGSILSLSNGPVEVTMFNVMGEEVFHQVITTSEYRLVTSDLSDGIYYFRIEGKSGVVIEKIIKQ